MNGGDTFQDCIKAIQPYFENELFWGIGINCCPLKATNGLLDELLDSLKPFEGQRTPRLIVYPNSGEVFNGDTYLWDGGSQLGDKSFLECAEQWIEKGVSVIGGCCRVEPETIKALDERFNGES
jgi:homocysteine S-methyltransferase